MPFFFFFANEKKISNEISEESIRVEILAAVKYCEKTVQINATSDSSLNGLE